MIQALLGGAMSADMQKLLDALAQRQTIALTGMPDSMAAVMAANIAQKTGKRVLMISGNGEVIEPDGAVGAIGSGGFFALSAARALVKHTDMEAVDIAKEAMTIAADICVFTNHNIIVEELE